MLLRGLSGFLVLLMLTASMAARLEAEGISVQRVGHAFEIMEDGKLLAVFNLGDTVGQRPPVRLQYLHPLQVPGGPVMTEDKPDDHVHQRGVYWAWRQIGVGGEQVANSWTLENIRYEIEKQSARQVSDDLVELGSDIKWQVVRGGDWQSIIAEKARINVSRIDQETLSLAFNIHLQALAEEVSLGGAPNSKGYGGVSVRFKDGPMIRFSNSEGVPVLPKSDPVEVEGGVHMAWDNGSDLSPYQVSMTCKVDGAAINKWILRRGLSMQNCVWPGRKPVSISQTVPVVLEAAIHIKNTRSNTVSE